MHIEHKINILHICTILQYSLEMVQSLRLSSDCVLNFNGKWLLAGKRDGVVRMYGL